MKRGWFGPRRWGWGASPASREGWLVTGVFALATIGTATFFEHRPHGWIAPSIVVVAYLVVVVMTYRSDAGTRL